MLTHVVLGSLVVNYGTLHAAAEIHLRVVRVLNDVSLGLLCRAKVGPKQSSTLGTCFPKHIRNLTDVFSNSTEKNLWLICAAVCAEVSEAPDHIALLLLVARSTFRPSLAVFENFF